MKRRDFLISLSVSLPVSQLLTDPALAAGADSHGPILAVSQMITGNSQLSPAIAERVADILSKRVDGFGDKLTALAKTLAEAGDRDAALAALSPEQVVFALQIAKPWYVGYVGTPSHTILKDDAEFVTFLEAQTYSKFLDAWPRPSAPGKDPGWWGEGPEGASREGLPEKIRDWSFHPDGVPQQIQAPDPAWRAYVTRKFASLQEAAAARPGNDASQN